MVRQQLEQDLKRVIEDLGFPVTDLVLSISPKPSFGDYFTNIALQLSKLKYGVNKHSPLEIAKKILSSLSNLNYLSRAEIKEPGFINFFIKPEVLAGDIKEILGQELKFGSLEVGRGKKARVEYVSANPTGPLHFGNARGGPIGDVLANVLQFSGFEVLREYLDNDRGNQVLELGKTLAARAGLILVPDEELAYKGEYTKELAEKIKLQLNSQLSQNEMIAKAGEIGVKLLFAEIIQDCQAMGINFDYIVHESDLRKLASPVLEQLSKMGVLKKSAGALWFAPQSEFLKDREAVVIKSDGSYTYLVADIVYHQEKFESGYDLVVDILGSNTSGHVPKLQALAQVLGFDKNKFKIILYQFVRVKRGNEIVRMSKRAGNFITAREVLNEVGKDALRFFVLMHDPNTHMDFDLKLAKEESNKNPVYYVQYAHARMANIINKVKSQKLKVKSWEEVDYNLIISQSELNLTKHLLYFPQLIAEIGRDFGVHRLTTYSINLADLFHKFYETCQVLNAGSEELVSARLALVLASQIILGNTLKLMGVSAPERM